MGSMLRLVIVFSILLSSLLPAQQQGSFEWTAPATLPTNGATISGNPSNVKITITKIEQRVVGGCWHDITTPTTICSNGTSTPDLKFGECVEGATFRISYKTTKADLSGDPEAMGQLFSGSGCPDEQTDDAMKPSDKVLDTRRKVVVSVPSTLVSPHGN